MSIKVSVFRCALLGALAVMAGGAGLPALGQTPATPPAPAAQLVGGPVGLAQVLQAARLNLDVALAERAWRAAQADVVAADRAPFPVLSTKASQMDLQNGLGAGNVLTQKRIDKSLGIDWTLERGNKRALRTQTAQRNAAAAEADLDDVRSQQILTTWTAFFDLLSAQERLVQIEAIAQSALQLANTAARRVSAGDLSVQEAARTEIEAERARADVESARLDVQRGSVELAQRVRLPAQTGVRPAELQPLQALPDWPAGASVPLLPFDRLAALAEQRADVRAALERVQAAQAWLDNSLALKTTDLTLGASMDHYPGTSHRLLELRLQMPLQWNYGYEGEIARAQAMLTQAQDSLDKIRNLALAELQRLQQEVRTTAQRAQSYEADILPRARRVAEGAELAYAKGAIPLTDLLDARRTLRATLLDALSARTDHAKAWGVWQLRTDPLSLPGRMAARP